jgi:hypothetical protein
MAGNARVADRMRKAAALMRARGLTVGAFAGWADAGRSSSFTPRAVVCHHTAAAIDVDRILRDGRADLPGPLCNWALHRDGSWWLVASGRANHAGVGWLPSSESYGIEATGPVPVTAQGVKAFPNYEQYVLGVACICEAEGWPASRVYAHKETATPDGRKIDPAFGDPFPKPYRDMDRFRGQVKTAMEGEDDMPLNDTDKKWLATKFEENERRTARYVDHGEADTTGSGNHHLAVRSDIADLATDLRALVDAVNALVEAHKPPPA